MKKAFFATDGDEKSCIVFAKNGAEARRKAANEMDCEFETVESCRRKPEFDVFADKGFVPAKVLIEHGWWFECNGCYSRVDSDCIEYNAEGLETDREIVPIYEGHGVWCSAECKASYEEDKRIRNKMQETAIEDFQRRVLKRFPGVEFSRSHAYVQQHEGVYGIEQVKVGFSFPGQKIAPATYCYDLNGCDWKDYALIGPRAPQYWCCSGDKEAFEAFAEATKEVAI